VPELRCPICRDLVPADEAIPGDDTDLLCPECGSHLLAGTSAPDDPPPVIHRMPSSATRLRLVFAESDESRRTEILVEPGHRVLLGRDPEYSPHAEFLAGYPGVSRRHAVVWVDAAGTAWVRDEYASNLTRVDGEPLVPGAEQQLKHDDPLLLCADLMARIVLESGETGDHHGE
jgi:hypothetical protein